MENGLHISQSVAFLIINFQDHIGRSPSIYSNKLKLDMNPIVMGQTKVAFYDLSVVIKAVHTEEHLGI
jgi:hypothetical protein